MIRNPKRRGLVASIFLILAVTAPTAMGENEVKLTIISEGLPPDINTRIFINQTAISMPLNGSKAAVLGFKKGTKFSIDIEDRVQGSLGTIFLKKGLFEPGTSTPVSLVELNSDITLVAKYEWSHFLLQPMLWPLYALVASTLFLLYVRRRYGQQRATKS